MAAAESSASTGDDSTRGGLTCVLADDHPAVLDAVSRYLEAHGINVTARARDGAQAVAQITWHHPSVALVDIRMPGMTGTEVVRRVVAANPETAVVLYTGYGDRELLMEALEAGAAGFVLKEAPLGDLVRAIEMVAEGQTYVDPALAGMLAKPDATRRLSTLTEREREVLRLLADGLPNEEIGRRLFISPETVRTHVKKAMQKLQADTRTQAVAEAIRQSLIA